MKPVSNARVAIVLEWLQRVGGSEQVITQILRVLPNTNLFAIVHDPESVKGTPLEGIPVRTSFIQSLPKSKEKFRAYLPLMPLAIEQFDLRSYDLVISS